MKYSDTERGRLSHKLRDGKYRARKRGCEVDESLTLEKAAVVLLKIHRCFYCSKSLCLSGRYGYSLEHKHALILGGAHTLENLTLCCIPCNNAKNDQAEMEYLQSVTDSYWSTYEGLASHT